MRRTALRLAGGGAAAAALVAAALAAVSGAAPVPANLDLLELPAPHTQHGERRLLLDIARAGTRLVAVGEAGLILHSEDEGASWHQSLAPSAVMLTALQFVDDKQGWAVGHDGLILASKDGGLSWQRQFDGNTANRQVLEAARSDAQRSDAEAAMAAGPSRPLMGLHFVDPRTGFVVGAFGQLFETHDAGTHWTYIGDRLPNPDGLHLNSVSAAGDGALYIAAEAGTVFRSRDQGRTWTRSELGYAGHLFGVLPLSNALLAYGFGGRLFRSGDGGTSWLAIDSPFSKPIVGAHLLDAQRVLLATQEGQLALSSDAGLTFRALAQRPALKKLSGFVVDGSGRRLWAVGLGGVAALTIEGSPR